MDGPKPNGNAIKQGWTSTKYGGDKDGLSTCEVKYVQHGLWWSKWCHSWMTSNQNQVSQVPKTKLISQAKTQIKMWWIVVVLMCQSQQWYDCDQIWKNDWGFGLTITQSNEWQ